MVNNRPVSNGKLLGGLPAGQTYLSSPDGTDGMSTWASTKKQAAQKLGLLLVDRDVLNIPMIATDPYGNFIPGPARGLPQYVTATGLVEGNLAAPVAVPANVRYFDTPFLTDIAHNADPSMVDTDRDGRPDTFPTKDADNTPSADFAKQPAGTYDDEMLDAHFTCGDGRCNENIGLSTIHQVFHSEHDRLIDDITATLNANPALKTAYEAAHPFGATNENISFGFGGRLFQAARFVTEMEYQHLVFEEFARKVQPAINPFEPFAFTQTEINPAIKAEFAHAVYRFGHSMLTDTISRTNANGTANDITLLDGFLNPPEYFDGGAAGTLTPKQAAGSIVMGMSDQTGNELDEFVTETLRNNLLGLPLDLATINMARARSEGIPPLNVFRRQVFNATNDGQMKPYTSWVDFGEHLKHPESLINFVAAYGRHPSITGASTVEAKRTAARKIVNPTAADLAAGVPTDASAFMNATPFAGGTNWSTTPTGLDSIDLWVGGLAETTNLFGGLLGSTFNYVFESQLTDLQNGDRLYYLARTPGMNLRTQLEGNSFAEMIMRNTNAHSLKADAFATADCKFELDKLAGTAAGFNSFGNTVADDPASDCDESKVLIRMADGTIKYRLRNEVDPPGINGQAVYNGTDGVDRVHGGDDNDTFWGGLGDDVIEGGDGADVALGGEGSDIITDLAGDDVPKGGPGDDAIDAGPGLDIVMGGEGKDFTNGGANANETFGGDGDDFIMLGDSLDAAFGDSGDDYEEGGNQPDLMQGDSGNLFFLDDSQAPGSDILVGQGGDDDYDMEGGDDIGVGGPGIEKVAGASGYDWEIGLGDPQAQDMDLAIPLAPLDILQVGVRDKFNEVEALSGADLDDTLRGDDLVPSAVGGVGFIGCDVLDQNGLNRIPGLDDIVPPLSTPLAGVVAQSASKDCPILSGPVWGDGNILLGGAGSDVLEGRGADDIIDGDRYLNLRLEVRSPTGALLGWADVNKPGQNAMTSQYQRNNGVIVPNSPTLMESVFAGTVKPGNIKAVREVVSAPAGTDIDTAVFSGAQAEYTVTTTGGNGQLGSPGSVTTVTHDGGGTDGIDTLRNVEALRFSDSVVANAPTAVTAVAGNGSATVSFVRPTNAPITQFVVQPVAAAAPNAEIGPATTIDGTATSTVITGLTNGVSYRFKVRADNAAGVSAFSALSNAVTPSATTPGAPTGVAAVRVNQGRADVSWTAPADNGGATITGYQVRIVDVNGAQVGVLQSAPGTARTLRVSGLSAPNLYRFQVAATNAAGTGPMSALSNQIQAIGNSPVVTAQAPAPAGLSAARTANVTVTFDTAVTGVSTTTFRLVDTVSGAAVPAAVSLSADGLVATLDPTASLASGRVFRTELVGGDTGITSLLDGTPIADQSWTFQTAVDAPPPSTGNPPPSTGNPPPSTGNPPPSTGGRPTVNLAPGLRSWTPAAGARGVRLGANVTARFTETVKGASARKVILVKKATGARVRATVTTSADGRLVTLNPKANLARNTVYRVTLLGGTTGIRDMANKPFAGAQWTFRTRP